MYKKTFETTKRHLALVGTLSMIVRLQTSCPALVRTSPRLYCTVLYCTVLCCTVLYCTVLQVDPPGQVPPPELLLPWRGVGGGGAAQRGQQLRHPRQGQHGHQRQIHLRGQQLELCTDLQKALK